MKEVIVSGIKMPVRHNEAEVFEKASAILKKHGVSPVGITIHKKSLDARRKSDIHFLYSVVAEVEGSLKNISDTCVKEFETIPAICLDELKSKVRKPEKVVVVGSGPCGLFAAYVLGYCGMDVTLLERGSDVDRRTQVVENFWTKGVLDLNTNIQFGEGGAGAFSDGKLSLNREYI